MPFEACGIVSFQSGCSSSDPLMIDVVSPTPSRACAATALGLVSSRAARSKGRLPNSGRLPVHVHSLQSVCSARSGRGFIAACRARPPARRLRSGLGARRTINRAGARYPNSRPPIRADRPGAVPRSPSRVRSSRAPRRRTERTFSSSGVGSVVSPPIAFLPASQMIRVDLGRLVTEVIMVKA